MTGRRRDVFSSGSRFLSGIMLFFSVFLVSPLFAAEPLSLDDAIAEALSRNQDILVAKGEEKKSSNNVNIIISSSNINI